MPIVTAAYGSLLRQWCTDTGRDLPTWQRIFDRHRKIWPQMAIWWRDTHGVPIGAWLGLEPVSPLPAGARPIRSGRPLEATSTLLGPWMRAMGATYASIGRELARTPIPRTTVQAYDQGTLAAPRVFRAAVQTLTHGWLHAEAFPNARP